MPRTPLPDIPRAADERATLTSFLDYYRAVVRRKAEGLSDEQLATCLPGHPSPLTIGNIVKHLGRVEVTWARLTFLGLPSVQIGEPWATHWAADKEWEWNSAGDAGAQLLEWYDRGVALAREVYTNASDLDALSCRLAHTETGSGDDQRYSLRWILVHLIEEYARHAGHLDLLREHLDGAVDD